MSEFQSGALPDVRTEEEKKKDYLLKEVVATVNPVNWVEKPPSQYRKFPIFNQDGSGSCVAQTEAKEMGIMRWLKDGNYVHFSATDIYQQRKNKPNAGMDAVDARAIATRGVTLEALTPSQNMTDAQMDGVVVAPYKREVGKVFSVSNYVGLPAKDIETVASVIQTTNKGVMVWFYFQIDEWTSKPEVKNPNLDLYAPSTPRHSVTAVDYALVNGKKCLIIEDSWGTSYGMAGQRIITEDFFKVRNWYASYLTNFKFDEGVTPKPKYVFNVTLQYGDQNEDVKALQDVLKYEGLFPSDRDSTGFYGGITANAVLAFQNKYGITPPSANDVGPKTRSKLNELYS